MKINDSFKCFIYGCKYGLLLNGNMWMYNFGSANFYTLLRLKMNQSLNLRFLILAFKKTEKILLSLFV